VRAARTGATLMSPEDADNASRNAALTLTLALPGDTVLYLLLPLHAAAFGITLPEAGFLLAANRIVRIFGYRWVAKFYATRGPRAACLAATGGAVLSTLGYATLAGIWPLLITRLIWGLAFAAMNIANQALPTAHMHDAARRMGRARSIVAIGPMLGLLAGGILAELFGPRLVFLALASLALIAPFFAWQLPSTPEPIVVQRGRFAPPDAFSVWSFCMGLALDGLFVFGLSLLAVAGLGRNGVIAASVAMALRYLSEILLSPLGATLAHRYGARRILVALSIAAAIGLALLGVQSEPVVWFGVIATVILRALLQPLPAPVIAEACPGAARGPALARQAVWRDIGAAAGPLTAGFVFPVLPAMMIYVGAAALFAGASLGLAKSAARRAAL
jgi:MFS family permease